jgi:hypothetical protein
MIWIGDFRDQHDKQVIYALEVDSAIEVSLAKGMEIRCDNMPTLLEKQTIEAIWSQGMIRRKSFDDVVDLLRGEREGQRIQPIQPIDQVMKREMHGEVVRRSQTFGESIPNNGCFSIIIMGNTIIRN